MVAAPFLALAIAFPSWWLTALGRFLIVGEPPKNADVIVVLAGDWRGRRILHAAELIKQGYASRALVSGPRHHYGLYEHELAIAFAVKHGYPADWFIGVPMNTADSTEDEAAQMVPELRRRGARRVLVVTSDYHTRRAGRIYRRKAPDLDIRLVAAADAVFHAESWWKTREARKSFFLEMVKVVTSPLGI